MDSVVRLLDEAQSVGLAVKAEGDRLIVEGPRSAEPMALRLLARKAEVLAVLTAPADDAVEADEPIDWWQHVTDEDREYLLGPEGSCPRLLRCYLRIGAAVRPLQKQTSPGVERQGLPVPDRQGLEP